MIEPTGSNKKPKLPARYPREPVIMFLGDMNGLDRVLELLSDLEKYLSALPDTITNDEWGKWCEVPLSYLAKCLRTAYVEYERFWRQDGWKLEDDPTLSSDLTDHHEMHWRVKDIDGAPYYDPAQHACAQSLHMALALMQCPGGNEWVEYCISTLRYELTRYHAAALEVVQHRNAVYLSAAHDEIKAAADELEAAAPNIKTGRKLRTSAQERAELQKREAAIKAEDILKKYHELYTGKNTKTHAVKLTADALGIGIATVWRAFPRIKKTTISRAD